MGGSVIKMNGNLFIRDNYIHGFLTEIACPTEFIEEFTNYILNIHNAIALDNVHYTFEYAVHNNVPHLFLLSAVVQ